MLDINNIRVSSFEQIPSPEEIRKKVPVGKKARETVFYARQDLQKIIDGEDKRQIVIVGPCSIHDKDAALEYAGKLVKLQKKVGDKFVLVMRAYFEKPRTTVGWKGFIYDPYLDVSYSLQEGIIQARKLLAEINSMGLPTATEVLGPIVIQYYADLICWSAIGARTAESQTHRELASGLSMPVGFKNGTSGEVDIAVNAIISARTKHHFLGMDENGKVSVVSTKGNPYCHVILRGGKDSPNYSAADVKRAGYVCEEAGIEPRIMIDCSHANSGKDYKNQAKVWKSVIQQVKKGSTTIIGLMLESHLFEGSQKIGGGFGELKYGVSVTDSCIGWKETEKLILESYKELET